MLRILGLVFLLWPSLSMAALFPALEYKEVSCQLVKDDVLVEEVSSSFMTLMIEESYGRFVELPMTEGSVKIKYQILIEDDATYKTPGPLIYLQNLSVDDVEVSSEFSGKDVTWVRLSNGSYSVRCELKK